MSAPFCSFAELLLPNIELPNDGAMPHGSHDTVPPQADAMEANTMSIETASSPEAGKVRSIRGSDQPHQHGGPEERMLHEIEHFRVKALETLEHSLEHFVRSVAADVLSRELTMAPADLQALIAQALRRYERESPIRLRVAAHDVAGLQTHLPVIADADLAHGDVVVEVRDGSIESRMPVRLACVVSRMKDSVIERIERSA